jgi:A/G-specific adenine glycosylase
MIINHFGGKTPNNLKDLLSLPGIGRSTAGAILSFAYNKEEPILDGNARRVLSRLFAVSGESRQLLWKISKSLVPKGCSNPFNQALMDLGSMLCTPKGPQCLHCPLRNLCQGHFSGKPESYPPPIFKKSIPHITAVSAVIQKDGKVLLNRRPPKGLLGGLWEFPNWKSDGKRSLRLRLRNYLKKEMGIDVEVKDSIGTFKQTFSHFKLTLHVYHCQALNGDENRRWIPLKNLILFPMSRIHRRIAELVTPRFHAEHPC